MIQLYLRGWSYHTFSEKVGINYTTLRRKLRGVTPFTIDEAKRVQQVLDCGMSLDELFNKRKIA